MSFRPFSSTSNKGWINSYGHNEFRDLAQQYRVMSGKVKKSAVSAVQETLVTPMVEAGAHPSLGVQVSRGGNLSIGVPSTHPDAQALANIEYGTQSTPAGFHIRKTLRDNGVASQAAFERNLVSGE